MQTNTVPRSTKSRFFAAVCATIIGTVAFPAAALDVSGIPQAVEYGQTPFLLVNIAGVNYKAQLTSPGCSLAANSIDTLKVWQSLAQGALLSGKNVRIYYGACSSVNYIVDIVLIK